MWQAKLKRLEKFKGDIFRKKLITVKPLAERINILFQSLNRQQENEKMCKEVNLIKHEQSSLPYIDVIFTTKKQNKSNGLALLPCLIDSGSEICILTDVMLEQFHIPKNCINKNCGQLNVVTSN